ncbi:hypothetical protein Tco_0563401 [Tanacetum coccineum]
MQNILYYLLVEKMYPLTKHTLHQMFNDVKLQVDYECEMAFELLRLVKKQLKEGYGRIVGIKSLLEVTAAKETFDKNKTMTKPASEDDLHGSDNTTHSANLNAKYKIGDEFLKILRDNTFNRIDKGDIIDHMAKVLEISEWIKIPNVDHNQIRLHIFPISLSGHAKECKIPDDLDNGTDYLEFLNWLGSKLKNHWNMDRNTKNGLWDFYVKECNDKGSISDTKPSKDECDEPYNKNQKNSCSDSFFKPYLDAQEGNRIYNFEESNQYSPQIPVPAECDIRNPNELCKSEEFTVVRYSIGSDEEFITLGPSKYDTWEKTHGSMMQYGVSLSLGYGVLTTCTDFAVKKSTNTDQGVGSTSGIRACALRNFDLEVMELENSQNNALAKLPMLKLGEYEMWEIRIKQYFQIQDYALWEVIENGNSWVPIPVTSPAKTVTRSTGTKILLQKLVSRLAILVWMNKPDFDTMGLDDLYNNFKIVEQKVKKSAGARNDDKNLAFNVSTAIEWDILSENAEHPRVKTTEIGIRYDDLLVKLDDTGFKAATYKRGHKEYQMGLLRDELEKVKQENEGFEFKISKFDKSAKDLEQLLASQITDKSKKSYGYNAVPSPHPLILNRPTSLDLSYSGLEEFKEPEVNEYGPRNSSLKPTTVCDKESDNSKKDTDDYFGTTSNNNTETSSKVRENNDAPIIEDWVSDDEDDDEPNPKVEKKTVIPTATKIEFVKPETPVKRSVSCPNQQRKRIVSGNNYNKNDNDYYSKTSHSSAHKHMAQRAILMKTGLKSVNTARPVNTGRPFSTARSFNTVRPSYTAHPKSTVHCARPRTYFQNQAQSTVHVPFYKRTTLTKRCFNQRFNTDRQTVNTIRVRGFNAVKPSACWVWRPIKPNGASLVFNKYNYIDARGRSKSVMAWVSDDEDDDEPNPKVEKKTVIPTASKIKFVKPEKPVKRSVSFPNQLIKRIVTGNNYNKKDNDYYSKTSHSSAHKHMAPRAVLMKTGLKSVNTARPSNSQLNDKGFIDSGCSRHMTGNITHLSDFKDFDGGYVTFGGGAYGGRITSKGTIKTDNLDFDDVYFVKELKFNLFSVLQMCDKKNYVLFTDSECLVLSPNFKLPDENQILLKIPKQDNMYSFDMKNIVPKDSLTCLVAKATSEESILWHRRLDLLTKGFDAGRFQYLVSSIGMLNL